MIQMYIQIDGKLTTVENALEAEWISLISPSMNEVHELSEQIGIPLEFLTSALDREERPRFETEDDVMMMLLRIPILDTSEWAEIPYYTVPLAVILNEGVFITVCDEDTPILNDFAQEKVKNFNLSNTPRFTLQLFYKIVLNYLRFLRSIENQTRETEKGLLKAHKNKELLNLLNYEKSLVYFSTSLNSNQIVIERLKRTHFFRTALQEERELLEDIIIDNAQAIEMARIYTNILGRLMDTFASVISNNLNNVMWILTKITIVLMLPTLFTSMYGMNMNGLPFANHPQAFWIVIGFSSFVSLITLLILNNRRWIN